MDSEDTRSIPSSQTDPEFVSRFTETFTVLFTLGQTPILLLLYLYLLRLILISLC